MSAHLHDALEVCLAALATGAKLDTCLALYPDLAEELRPLLLTAQQARQAARQEVPVAAMNRSRAKFIARTAELRRGSKPPSRLLSFSRLAMATLAVVLIFFLSINGLVVVSAKSLPGDTLYPVKLAAENVSLRLAPNDELRQRLSQDYQQRRADELRSLLAQNLVRNISLEGVISQVNPNGVLIDNLPIIFDAQTKISGDLLPGRLVKLTGVTQPGGFIKADSIQLRFYEYAGEVRAIQSNAWLIGDTSFTILNGTRIDPALRIGDRVLVLVYAGDDDRLYAQAILRIPEHLSNPTKFEPFEIEFSGVIEAISGDMLTINGKNVQISSQTEIKGEISTGTQVKVHAQVAEDGSLTAIEIEPQSRTDNQGEGDQKDDENNNSESDDSSKSDADDRNDDSNDDSHKSGDDSSGDDHHNDDKQDEDKKKEDTSGNDSDKSDDGHQDDDSKDSDSGTDDNGDKDDDAEAGLINSILFERLI